MCRWKRWRKKLKYGGGGNKTIKRRRRRGGVNINRVSSKRGLVCLRLH